VYQIASVTRWGRNTGQRTAEPVDAAPAPAEVVRVTRSRAGIGAGGTLVALDTVAGAAISVAAGSAWAVTAVRIAAILVALALAGLYRSRLQFSVLDDLPRLTVAVAAVLAGAAWLRSPAGLPLLWAAALAAAIVAGRVAGYRLLRHYRRRHPGRAAIVVGCGGVAVHLAEALRADRGLGIAPVGFVGPPTLTPLRLPILAPVADLEAAVAKYRPLHLIVAFPAAQDADLVPVLRRCRKHGVTVHVVPRLFELAVGRGPVEAIRGIPLIRLRAEPAQLRRWAVKRFIDVLGAILGLILLSPVLAICALAVLCESGRHGVLFRQERISRDGKPFTILKFRSLTPASDLESQVKWNINTDARLGLVGKILRFSSLDELPQLLNVLRGDMSLVGPRPERPFFVEEFQRTYAGYPDRHRVPAGITGWAQIHGLRGDTSIEERVRFDNHYIEHWSLGLDIKIILRTVGAMLSIHRA
jgi:exopolysaccharide biosynthesis polyprenyl glycosylphosphotransferase